MVELHRRVEVPGMHGQLRRIGAAVEGIEDGGVQRRDGLRQAGLAGRRLRTGRGRCRSRAGRQPGDRQQHASERGPGQGRRGTGVRVAPRLVAAVHTLRVATAGGIEAARRAGAQTASWPSAHSSTAPAGR